LIANLAVLNFLRLERMAGSGELSVMNKRRQRAATAKSHSDVQLAQSAGTLSLEPQDDHG
jgi:hypothetical protein